MRILLFFPLINTLFNLDEFIIDTVMLSYIEVADSLKLI